MASDKLVFMRPVVIGTSQDSIVFDGGGKTITNGTYPSIGAVLYELMTQCSGVTATFSSDFKVTLTKANNFAITWTDTDLGKYLGFTGNLSGNTTYTATYTPRYCWFPSRVRADNNAWIGDLKASWKGKEALSGNVCGLQTGATIYRMTYNFEALNDYEVLIASGATSYQQYRCLEYFAAYSRSTYGAAGAVSPGGFYVFPDYTNAKIGASADYTSGSINFDYSSSASTFTFAHFDADWYPKPAPTIKNAQTDWYDVGLEVHTATAPTWTGA